MTFRDRLQELNFSDLSLKHTKSKVCRDTIQGLKEMLDRQALPNLRCITSPSLEEPLPAHLDELLHLAKSNKVILEGDEDHW